MAGFLWSWGFGGEAPDHLHGKRYHVPLFALGILAGTWHFLCVTPFMNRINTGDSSMITDGNNSSVAETQLENHTPHLNTGSESILVGRRLRHIDALASLAGHGLDIDSNLDREALKHTLELISQLAAQGLEYLQEEHKSGNEASPFPVWQ
jgi:hypothetical protein